MNIARQARSPPTYQLLLRQYTRKWVGPDTAIGSKLAPFQEARAYVPGLCLQSETEWRAYCKAGKKPDDIPAHADRTYADAGCGDERLARVVATTLKVLRK